MGDLRIAVTGGNGFLGGQLVRTLQERGIKPLLFDSNRNSLFEIDRLKDFVEGKDLIYHLAGANRDTDFNLIKVNTLGTMGLLEAMVKYGKKGARIILSSSFQVYSPSKEGCFVDEDKITKPISVYGISKLAAENLIENYCRVKGIKGIIFRFSNLYGKGGRPYYNSVVATFLHLIREGKPLVVNGTGGQKKDFLFVGDAVEAMLKILNYTPKTSEVFNICSGELISLNEIIDVFRKVAMGKEINVNYNSEIKEESGFLKGNYKKALEVLGWSPKAEFKTEIKKIYEG